MSRYRYWWYGMVRAIISRYNELDETKEKEKEYKKAIDDAITETLQKDEGSSRVKAVQMVYIENRYTINGMAKEVYWSERKVKKWLSDFVLLVGSKIGFDLHS